jgi:acid phosphatase type 7
MRSSWTIRVSLLVLVLLAFPVCMAGNAGAARAKNGAIAFAGRHAGKLIVYTRRANGSRLRAPLGRDGSDQPAFSPQGRRLAIRRFGLFGPEIWVSYLGRIGFRRLTSGRRDGEPAWSPGGDAIAFARGRRGRRDVYSIKADGTQLRRLTRSTRDDSSPAWSRRNLIAFVRRNPRRNDDIYVMSARGGHPHRLTGSRRADDDPAWSPSGRTLAFARGRPGRRDLYLMTASGAHRRLLTRLPGDESEPAWSPNGRWIAFSHRRGRKRWIYVFRVGRRPLTRLSSRFHRLTSTRSASRSPSWQPTGFDPLIAAAGDIACDPASPSFNGGVGRGGRCRELSTSNLLLRMDLARVLELGDAQYEDGTLDKFRRSYDPSWGRIKQLTSPVPGNHEYKDPRGGASGYFDYFNGPGAQTGPAGDRSAGYYSFDLGSWHVLALNSECTFIGGCGANSPQLRWIRADLAAHPASCTLAYFHRPLFTSGGFESQDNVRPIWDALYPAGVDLVLNGHDHIYERFAPQRPDGSYDPGHGIREFTAGMGGVGHHQAVTVAPNSQVEHEESFGVLTMTLRRGGYDWHLVTQPRGTTADSGAARCH